MKMEKLWLVFGLVLIANIVQRNQCRFIINHNPEFLGQIEDMFNKGLASIPRDLDPDTAYLMLDQNDITQISNLEYYPNLLYLTLSQNQMATSDDLRGVRAARKLEFLDLSGNGLLTFNLNTFRQNSKLQVLMLDNNPGLMIDGSIPYLPRLEQLSLRNCSLTSMPWSSYNSAPKLKILDLLGNPIKDVPVEVVRSLPRSVELVVDDELCLVLANRADIKKKLIKLTCGASAAGSSSET